MARSYGSEPHVFAQDKRLEFANAAVSQTERNLGLVSTSVGLVELQAAFLEEASFPRIRIGLRGTRAGQDVIFRNLAAGRIELADIRGESPTDKPLRSFDQWHYKKLLPFDHVYHLERLTRAIEITYLPERQQLGAIAELNESLKDSDYILSRAMCWAYRDALDSDFVGRARLRCAAAGLAVERFRLTRGRWPNTLDEIPKEILPEIPMDPYDGLPLKYARRPDGVIVYSVGHDARDDGGMLGDMHGSLYATYLDKKAKDVGFQLFNVELRGLPALPPKPPGFRDE